MNDGLSKIGHDFGKLSGLKIHLENNVFNKKWSPKLIFLYETKMKIDLECMIFTLFNKLSFINIIFSFQESCILGPTIFEIPQPN